MKKMHLAIICLFTGCTIFAQHIEVQPIPQQVSKQDGQINLPETYQLLGETEANPILYTSFCRPATLPPTGTVRVWSEQ